MNWTAVIPLRGKGERKTRLSSRLDADERSRLSEAMFVHVATILRASPYIGKLALLSNVCPDDWKDSFFADQGRGLNAEIREVAMQVSMQPLLVIHADLALVSVADVTALIEAAGADGIAIAPDQHGTGTNAIAFSKAPKAFRFAFGPDSFARHIEAIGDAARIVKRTGLAIDLDTPEDYNAALAMGLSYLH